MIELTGEQQEALEKVKRFSRDETLDAFVLSGSAGTGKTTLIAKMVEEFSQMEIACALLAPTGRAARILGSKVSQIIGRPYESRTIHSAIYYLSSVEINEEAQSRNDPGVRFVFPLKEEEPMVPLFIIDESSMVGDKETRADFVRFGNGQLLKDVVTYARLQRPGRGNESLAKLIFVGDPAQLPPIGEKSSPALSEDYLCDTYNLNTDGFELKQVMRQAQGSAILEHATRIRDDIQANSFNSFSLKADASEITNADPQEAISRIIDDLRDKKSSVAIVQTNAAALEYNESIRERLWGDHKLPAGKGDTLLVNKNSTKWQLSNGDLVKLMKAAASAEIVPVRIKGRHFAELRFRDVEVAFRNGAGEVIRHKGKILENLLDSRERELTAVEQRALLVDFRKRYPNLRPDTPEFGQVIKSDPYFNALQVKYGYAMTCHKAQGGEWHTAIVDFSTNTGQHSSAFFRWAYTAITRASSQLVLVNPPDFTATSEIAWHANSSHSTANNSLAADKRLSLHELQRDPDWNRFSFSAQIAALMLIHQKLRSVWNIQGIDIEQLQHLQYCERYILNRGGKRASIQYYYNKKNQVGRSGLVPGAISDEQLAEDALSALSALNSNPGGDEQHEFIQQFLAKLDAALDGTSIQRTAYKALPYRVRVNFTDNIRSGEVDFTYDGKARWTSAQEVGGQGSTRGLYDEVQERMQG